MRWIVSPLIAALGILLFSLSVLPFVKDAQNLDSLVGATWPLVGVYIAFAALGILAMAGFIGYVWVYGWPT